MEAEPCPQKFIAQAKKAMRISDPELVWTFFLAFSRFEYSLKQAGYRNIRAKGTVSANWQRFASNYHHLQSIEIHRSARRTITSLENHQKNKL
jgi:hypothetical protein